MKDHNIDRLVDALQRLTIEVQLFREAFVANNTSICESCSNNPCNKKAMLGDRHIFECTMYDRKTENNSEKPNNCEKDCFLCKWLGDVDVCGRCRNRNLFVEADTEPTISKMEQVDKDINVRSKDEPQTERSE